MTNNCRFSRVTFRNGSRPVFEPDAHTPGRESMTYYVYLLASRKGGATYLGVTNDLVRRTYEHKTKAVPSFASRYNIVHLVWFEVHEDPIAAISREKEIKKWRRLWKVALIEKENPTWSDLYDTITR
jgi:putative endonuclease